MSRWLLSSVSWMLWAAADMIDLADSTIIASWSCLGGCSKRR